MKKNILIKLAAIFLLAALLLFSFTACKKKTDGENKDTNDTSNTGDTQEVAIPDPIEEENDKTFIAKVADQEVSLADFRYYLLNYKKQFDGGDATVWEKDTNNMAKVVKETAMNNVKSNIAIVLLAKEYNAMPTDDEIAAKVKESMKSTMDYYKTAEAYYNELKNYYMTDKVFRNLSKIQAIQDNMIQKLCTGEGVFANITDDEMFAYAKDNYVHAIHILIKTEGLSDEDKAKKKATAEEILAKAKGGEDFVSLFKQYNEDTGETEQGYYFTHGSMVKEFEDSAYSLQEGEISDIVESTYGYHIIKKLSLNNDEITANTKLVSEIKLYAAYEKLLNLINERAGKLDVTYYDNYNALDVKTMQ